MGATNDFGISLNATLNTKNAEKRLEEFQAQLNKSTTTKVQIPVDIETGKLRKKLEEGKTELKSFFKEVNTYKTQMGDTFKDVKILDLKGNVVKEEIQQVTSSLKDLATETQKCANESGDLVNLTTTINNLGQEVQTQITTHKEFGKTIQETTTSIKDSNGEWVQVGETLKNISTVVGETSKSINKYRDDTGATVTEIHELTKAGEQLKTVIKEEATAEGEIVKTTELWNEASNTLLSTHKETLKDEIKLEEQQKRLQQSLVETSKVTNRLKDSSGAIITTIEEIDKSGDKIFTTITEIDNGLGGLITKTEKYKEVVNEQGQVERQILELHTQTLNDQVKEIENAERLAKNKQQLTTTTRELEQTIEREGREYRAVVKTIEEETAEYGKLTTTIITYKNALGETVVETTKVNEKGEHVAQNQRTITKELNNTSNSLGKYNSATKRAAQETKTFGQSLSDAISRLAKYYIASLPIQVVRKAISEAITTVKEFDSALIEFRKVSDLAGESLTAYTEKLAKLGEVTGSTMQAMVEAATEFRKSGFSDEDSAKLASIAEKYRNIADEEISAGESASFIIAQMKAFNIEADQAEHIIDSVNEVANNFSVSSADLATNLGNMSAIMAINNVSLEEQIGMLTGVTEITRNASSASRGLVMVSSRLTQVLDDTSSTGKKLTKIYENLGIELKDENGQLRSHYDILGDLAGVWDELSENEQKYIALTSAGARQQQNFVALMENWSQVASATTTAYNSLGSAQKENEKVMDSISKKVEILKSQFQQLVIGKGGLQEVAKIILDIGIAFLKFANSDIGKLTIAIIALEVATHSLINNWTSLIKILGNTSLVRLIRDVKALAAGQQIATKSTLALNIAQKGLAKGILATTKAWLTSPMGMASIAVAGIALMAYAMKNYAEQLDHATENLKELAEQSENTKSELTDTKTQLEKIQDQIKKNNQQKLNITNHAEISTLEKETTELENQESSLKRQIELLELKLELENKAAEEAAKKTYETKGASNIESPSLWDSFKTMALNPYGVESRVEATVTMVTPAEEMDKAIQKIEELTAKKDELFKKNIEELRTNGELTDTYKQQQKELADLDDQINDAQQAGQKAEDTLETILGSLKSNSKETVELRDKINSQLGSWLDVNKEVDKTVDAYNRLKELSKGGAVDLTIRPIVDDKEMVKAGWAELTDSGSYSTTYTSTFTNKALTKAVNFTPILTDENGNFKGILSPAELQKYAEDVLNGVHGDFKHLQIGMEVNAEEFNGSIDKAIEEANKRAEEEHDWQEIFYEAEAAARGFIDAENDVIDSNDETSESSEDLEKKLNDLVQTLGLTAIQLEEIAVRVGDANLMPFLEQMAQIKSTISDTSTEIDNLQSALSTAQTALDEYTESGYLTLDTFQELMNVSALYLTSLVNENGQIEINQQTLNNLVETLKVAKVQELQNAEVQDILAYANGNVAEMSDLAQVAVASAGNAAQLAGQKASNGALGFWDLTAALNAANQAATGKKTIIDDSAIRKIHSSYQKLANSIVDVKVNTTAAGNAATKAGKKGAGAAKQAKDATKDLNKELEETKKKYETVIKWITKQYDKKIDSIKKAKDEATKAIEKEIKALEKEKDSILDNIEKETNALEKEKEARQKYWDDQIDALKKANQEKKDALELQEKLDALEKARNTKVKIYKEGQGFVYDVDQTAVAEAQKALDEYLSEKAYEDELARLEALKDAEMKNYEDRIDALNDYKDKVSQSYEEQIDALNAHKEALEEQYDAEIEMYENYKQQFEDMVNAYQEQQDKLLAEQLLGIKLEGDNWMTRLDNLAEFVRKYNELQKQLDTGNTGVSNDASMKSGGGGGGGSKGSTSSKTLNQEQGRSTRESQSVFNEASLEEARKRANLSRLSGGVITYSAHADGIGSINSDEIAVVGENPNKEIVIGSKINNGELMNLGKGTGVVNADSSKTLAGMLNQVGQFGASGFGSGNGTLNSNINNDTLTINGVTIQGSNIKDPETFVNGLLNLKAEALQRAYKHR